MDIKDIELLKQDPFQYNCSEQHIACVGDNGGTTNKDILAGFKSAAEIIINDIKYSQGIEDVLIYPLFYSMRHCVELALKISIYYIRNICHMKKVNSCIEEKALYTHDIEKLAGFLKQLYVIDKRIPELFDTALEYVEDYYIDKQSDVFRYEHNHDGKELLKLLDISQICIGILEEKFLRMYELLDNAICCLEDIRYEYSLKTWTNELSRNDMQYSQANGHVF